MKVSPAIQETVINGLERSVAGFLSVWAFTSLNPLAGFVFGASYSSAGCILDKVMNSEASTFGNKLLRVALKLAISSAVVFASLGVKLGVRATIGLGTVMIIGAPIVHVATLFLIVMAAVIAAVAMVQFERGMDKIKSIPVKLGEYLQSSPQ